MEAQDCHRHSELKRKIYSALQESDEGELSIAIPTEVPLKQSGHSSSGMVYGHDGKSLFINSPEGHASHYLSSSVYTRATDPWFECSSVDPGVRSHRRAYRVQPS